MFANFSWFWKHKFQTLLSLLVQKDVDQKRSAFSQHWGLHFVPLPCFITISSFIHCYLPYVNQCKKSYIINHPSSVHCRSSIESFAYLYVSHAQCVVSYLFQQQQARMTIRSMLFTLCLLYQGIMCRIDIHLITRYMCKLDMSMYCVNYWVFILFVIFILLRYYFMCVKVQFRKH